MSQHITEREAIALWENLRSAVTNFVDALRAVIEAKAWEPLGYSSLAEAWADRMAGTPLSSAAAQALVVYALLDEGLPQEEIVETVGVGSGIGPKRVELLARQKEVGVPPEFATNKESFANPVLTAVRSHMRERPGPPRTIRVVLSDDEYQDFHNIADRRGLDVAEEALKAVRSHFRQLERIGRRSAV